MIRIDRIKPSVYTDNYGNRNGCFRGGNRDDEQGKEQSFYLLRKQEFVECNEVNIDSI